MEEVKSKRRKMVRQRRPVYKLTQEEEDKLRAGLVAMYRNDDSGVDPLIKANIVIRRVCNAELESGAKWWTCPMAFEDRLKSFGFDLATYSPIPGFKEKRKAAQKKGRTSVADQIPKELNKGSNDPIMTGAVVSSKEEMRVTEKFEQLIEDFPDIAASSDLDLAMSYCRLLVVLERVGAEAIEGGKIRAGFLDDKLIPTIASMQKMLGIDKASRDRAKDEMDNGSIADLVTEWEEYVESGEAEKQEFKMWVEEAAMCLRKMDRQWPDGTPEMTEQVFQRFIGFPSSVVREIVRNPYFDSLDKAVAAAKMEMAHREKQKKEEILAFRSRYRRLSHKDREGFRKRLKKRGLNPDEIAEACDVPFKRKKE